MSFSGSELLQFAIQIEENGVKFYLKLAEKLENGEIKAIIKSFAEDETEHRETFSQMLSKIETYKNSENYPDEYFLYLKSYAKNVIFAEKKEQDLDIIINEPYEAFNFAMKKELESILYYQEMRGLVLEKYQSLIDKIIEEERDHFVKLGIQRDKFKK